MRPAFRGSVSAAASVTLYGPAPLFAVSVRVKEGSRQATTSSSLPSMRSRPPLGHVLAVPGVVQAKRSKSKAAIGVMP